MMSFLVLTGIFIAFVLILLLGVRKGRKGRVIATVFFTCSAIYFMLMVGQAIYLEDTAGVIITAGLVFVAAVLGWGFITGRLKKNE